MINIKWFIPKEGQEKWMILLNEHCCRHFIHFKMFFLTLFNFYKFTAKNYLKNEKKDLQIFNKILPNSVFQLAIYIGFSILSCRYLNFIRFVAVFQIIIIILHETRSKRPHKYKIKLAFIRHPNYYLALILIKLPNTNT